LHHAAPHFLRVSQLELLQAPALQAGVVDSPPTQNTINIIRIQVVRWFNEPHFVEFFSAKSPLIVGRMQRVVPRDPGFTFRSANVIKVFYAHFPPSLFLIGVLSVLWCACTPKAIRHFRAQRRRNLFTVGRLPSLLRFNAHSTAILEYHRLGLPSSSRESNGLMGFMQVNFPRVTHAYHHSLTVRRFSPGWLLLSLPSKVHTERQSLNRILD